MSTQPSYRVDLPTLLTEIRVFPWYRKSIERHQWLVFRSRGLVELVVANIKPDCQRSQACRWNGGFKDDSFRFPHVACFIDHIEPRFASIKVSNEPYMVPQLDQDIGQSISMSADGEVVVVGILRNRKHDSVTASSVDILKYTNASSGFLLVSANIELG